MTIELCLRERSAPPYGGLWELHRPDIGIVGTGYIFDVLVDNCRTWRVANAIPVGLGFEYEVQKACCEAKPDHCRPCDPVLHPRTLTFSDVFAGTQTMFRHILAGSPLVPEVEAERRAEICSRCPFNVSFSTPCNGICESLKKMVKAITGSATTSRNASLRSCFFCGCFLQSAVWLPLAIQLKPLSQEQKDKLKSVGECWKKE